MPKPIVEYLAIVGNFTILIHEAGPKSNVTTYVFNMVIRFYSLWLSITMVTDVFTMVM